MSKVTDGDGASQNFEETLAQLEEIVGQLEQGKLGLSESLEKYEHGIELLKQCHERLHHAERKIRLLTRFDADGNAVTEPFDESATSTDAAADDRARKRGYGQEPPSDQERRLF